MSFWDSDQKSCQCEDSLTHNDNVIAWRSELVYLGGSRIGPLSCLQHISKPLKLILVIESTKMSKWAQSGCWCCFSQSFWGWLKQNQHPVWAHWLIFILSITKISFGGLLMYHVLEYRRFRISRMAWCVLPSTPVGQHMLSLLPSPTLQALARFTDLANPYGLCCIHILLHPLRS